MRPPDPVAPDTSPVSPQRDADREERQDEGGREDRDHRVMREIGVETLAGLRPQALHGSQQQGQRQHQKRRDREPLPLEKTGEARGPGKPRPILGPGLGEDARDVHRELVRRDVLAGIIATPAVVAKMRELHDVAIGEDTLPVDRREDGAIAFAIAAGIADLDLPAGLGDRARQRVLGTHIKQHRRRLLVQRGGRKLCRWSFRTRPYSLPRGCCPP